MCTWSCMCLTVQATKSTRMAKYLGRHLEHYHQVMKLSWNDIQVQMYIYRYMKRNFEAKLDCLKVAQL